MHRGLPKPSDSLDMLGSRVPFVAVKPVSIVAVVQLYHLPVTGDFGDDRRRRDGGAPSVAPDDTTLWKKQAGNPETVDQDEVRQRNQAVDGSAHRLQ